MSNQSTWECKIGEIDLHKLPPGSDAPMRAAVHAAYNKLTGEEAQFCFSGWGAELTESQRAVANGIKASAAYTSRLDAGSPNPTQLPSGNELKGLEERAEALGIKYRYHPPACGGSPVHSFEDTISGGWHSYSSFDRAVAFLQGCENVRRRPVQKQCSLPTPEALQRRVKDLGLQVTYDSEDELWRVYEGAETVMATFHAWRVDGYLTACDRHSSRKPDDGVVEAVTSSLQAYGAILDTDNGHWRVRFNDGRTTYYSPKWDNVVGLLNGLYRVHSPPQEQQALSFLHDILCVIHRDGGHYTDKHGLEKSVSDARTKCSNNIGLLDSIQARGSEIIEMMNQGRDRMLRELILDQSIEPDLTSTDELMQRAKSAVDLDQTHAHLTHYIQEIIDAE